MDGYRKLEAGQTVEFDIEQGTQGLQAINVELVN
jgi:cold shock CspA family protein